MNFSKEMVAEKILPYLFHSKTGKSLFNSAKKHFEQIDTKIDTIIQEFDSVDLNDESFWEGIIDILSIVYEKEINKKSLIELLESDTNIFFEKVLSLRFEYEFVPDDEVILVDINSFDDFITENLKSGDNFIIEDGDITKIFLANRKSEKTYVKPFQLGELKFYPVSLIKIDRNNKKILLNGSKTDRTHLINQINEFDVNMVCKENVDELLPFTFDISQLFHIMRDKGFYLKNVKFHGSFFNLNLSVTGNNVLEISEFINPELILCDISDFIKLKQMKFDYYFDGDKNIPFNLVVENYHQKRDGIDEKYFKIILKITSRRKDFDLSEIEQSIIEELNSIGIQINKAYNMPNSYYFDNFVHAKDESRPIHLKILMENPESKPIIDKLFEKGVLSKNGAEFDYDKYLDVLSKILRSLKGERIKVKDESFEILEINKKKTSIRLRVKIYSDAKEKKYSDYYSVIIQFGSRLTKMDRIHNIILSDLNIYKILLNHEDYPTEVLNEVYSKVKIYLLYHYKQLLGKEANISHNWLVKYSDNPFEFKDAETPTKSGYTVEYNVNVLLKFLFGNYLAVGSRNKPDGFLGFEGNIAYVIDSKQHQELEKSEFTKLRDYVHSYRKEENSYDIKGGVLVICKKILKNNSLNPSSRKEVLKDTDAIIGYLSLEYLLDLYDFYSKYFNLDLDIRTKLRTATLKVIEKSSESTNINDLEKIENEQIKKLYDGMEQSSTSSISKKEELL